jgi:thymidylate synthase ThyX
LAIEAVEGFRLVSYTEKSQRYVTLDEDFVVPEEIKQTPFLNDFINIIGVQNRYYQELLTKLKNHFLKRFPESSNDPKAAENFAKENARYITSLAIESQLGATMNARNLELMLRRFASHPLAEIRELGSKLFALTEKIAPSIVLFYQANEYDRKTYPELGDRVQKLIGDENSRIQGDDVQLVYYTPDADNILIAALLHRTSNLPFNKCLKKARKLMLYQKKELLKAACQYLQFYDAVLREFEHIYLTFDLVVSASCFAQLKRHRMATITTKAYDPELGVTVPKPIEEIGESGKFVEIIRKTEDIYEKIYKRLPLIAQYVLTDAHQKRVLISLNARELYHISRLREDKTAQWDIRNKTKKMVEAAKHFMPLTLMLTGGKDQYNSIYKEVFGNPTDVKEKS